MNPIGIDSARSAVEAVQIVFWLLVLVLFGAAGAATVIRVRRSTGATHQQIKWVAYAAAILGVVWAQWTVLYITGVMGDVMFAVEVSIVAAAMAGVPVAMGIAILRYRLYGIDVIIRKTLVYAALIAILAAVYIGGVVVLSEALRSLVGGSGAVAVTVSTLGVAAMFQPLRRRVQHAVDRRFYRDRYDSTRIVGLFNHRCATRSTSARSRPSCSRLFRPPSSRRLWDSGSAATCRTGPDRGVARPWARRGDPGITEEGAPSRSTAARRAPYARRPVAVGAPIGRSPAHPTRVCPARGRRHSSVGCDDNRCSPAPTRDRP